MVRKSSRVVSIIGLLQSGRTLNSRQIAEECGVTRRTVFRDLIALQEAGIHPTYDPQKQTYALPANQIPASRLTLDEVAAVTMAVQSATPKQAIAKSGLARLFANLTGEQRQTVDRAE